MSVDPSAVIVAVATAASALVQGVDLPAEIKDQINGAIESFEATAENADTDVANFVASLPEPMQQGAQQAVADATTAVAGE